MLRAYNIGFLLVIAMLATTVLGDIFEQCNGVNERTFILSNTSCSRYIFCDGENSFEGECAAGEYFNEKYQTCDPQEMVECELDLPQNPNGAQPTLPLPNTLTPLFTTPAAQPATSFNMTAPEFSNTTAQLPLTTRPSTDIWALLNTTSSSGINATITNSSSSGNSSGSVILTSTVPTTTSNSSTVPPFIIATDCPALDDPDKMVFVLHTKSCSEYFLCYRGEAKPMHCSAMLHFNGNTGKCDYPENVKCHIDFVAPKEQCQSHTTDLYPHPRNCNYFYNCRSGYLLLQQCPFFYGWDYEKRTCVPMKQASCYQEQQHL